MVYVLYGLVTENIKKEISKITQNTDELSIIKYDLINENLDDIIYDCLSFNLFGGKKIIIVNNAFLFTSKNVKDINTDNLEQYLNDINDQTILIFISNTEKLDERKKLTKLVRKNHKVLEYNDTDTINNIKDMFGEYKIKLMDINLLIERVGEDLTLLKQEINKIKIYKNNNLEITSEDIIDLTTKKSEDNNFKLLDAIIQKDKKSALQMYHERINAYEEPIVILISLANQIRILYQVKQLSSQGYKESEIASLIGIHPYRVKLARTNAKSYTSNQLVAYLSELANLDYEIKHSATDKTLSLELFILNL